MPETAMIDAAVDVRHLPYMPLQIERLRKSKAWLRCKRRPELAFYQINLWMRAWHEFPAGTIENDDDVLADAAMCDPETWDRIKADVLTGWDIVGDRVCHSTVTELATEAALKIKVNQVRTEAARRALKTRREREAAEQGDHENGDETDPPPRERTVTDSVTKTVTKPEGKGREGKVEGNQDSESPAPRADARASEPAVDHEAGSYLPTEFPLSPEWEQEAVLAGLPIEHLPTSFGNFCDHFHQVHGPQAKSRNWRARWRKWVRKDVLELREARKPASNGHARGKTNGIARVQQAARNGHDRASEAEQRAKLLRIGSISGG